MLSTKGEKVRELAEEIAEVIAGEHVDVGVSALLTTMIDVLASVTRSKEELIRAVADIGTVLNPASLGDAWDHNNKVINH